MRRGAYKLSPRDVLDVRALLASGQSTYKVGKLFNVAPESVKYIAKGHGYKHIQTEEDLYKWHELDTGRRKFAYAPAIHKIYDAYCGFKLTSYGLRKYGRKNISVILDTIKICEHGDLCEECCFIYSGPKKGTWENYLVLPSTILTNMSVSLDTFIIDIAFNCALGKTQMTCKNYYCANVAHLFYLTKRKYVSTRQEIARDH